MIQIYHNNRCRKSREGLAYLEKIGLEFEIIEYLKYPLTEDALKQILKKLNIKPINLIRTQEAIWKSDYKGKILNDEQIIKAMVKHPKLIERPIIVNNQKAVVARPLESVAKIL